MKTLIIGVLLVATFLISGCSTTGKVIATSSTTVDHAMQAWAVYVVDGKASMAQEQAVRAAKEKYDAAEDAAVEAYIQFSKDDYRPAWEKARDYLTSQAEALTALIQQFTGEKL
jgi:transcriptional regulator GlxA family with amidase domain